VRSRRSHGAIFHGFSVRGGRHIACDERAVCVFLPLSS
jgi:hypothetical protein